VKTNKKLNLLSTTAKVNKKIFQNAAEDVKDAAIKNSSLPHLQSRSASTL